MCVVLVHPKYYETFKIECVKIIQKKEDVFNTNIIKRQSL